MFKTSYTNEVRKEKYERSEVFQDDPKSSETSDGTSAIQGWTSLQELNSRFARYINRARILEQRNAVFRKQLETLRRMEKASGLEEAFSEQVEVNRQRIRELTSEHVKLQRELKEACSMLDNYTTKYRNEREYQEQLRNMLELMNEEADDALLKKMELQIQSQFLQDDISATKDIHRKNLAEIETYVGILQQINQTTVLLPHVTAGTSEEQEKLRAQKRVPGLQSQLEEYKSALCQLQAQKQRLQNETALMEQAIKSTQQRYDDEIQMYNEQIESLRKQIEEAERSLERYTSECRRVAMYQTSLEHELERYKRLIENEDSRLNSAIIGTPMTLFTTNYHYTPTTTALSKGKDITQAIQDITSIKPRQRHLAKRVTKNKEPTPEDVKQNIHEEKPRAAPPGEAAAEEQRESQEEEVNKQEQRPTFTGASPQDVPDGAQISKAFDTLCDIVQQRIRRYRKAEPIADFYTKGRYVLVTGEGSYLDPCFCTSLPSAGHVYVTIRDGWGPPYHIPSPPPSPQPFPGPTPPDPTLPSNGEFSTGDDKGGRGKDGGKGKHKKGEPHPRPKDLTPSSSHSSSPPSPGPIDASPRVGDDNPSGPKGSRAPPMPPPRGAGASLGFSFTADSMRYEMVEKFSNDHKMKGYEETSMVVETTIEKSSKKKH